MTFCKRANKPGRSFEEAVAIAFKNGKREYKCEFCKKYHLSSKDKKVYQQETTERLEIDSC